MMRMPDGAHIDTARSQLRRSSSSFLFPCRVVRDCLLSSQLDRGAALSLRLCYLGEEHLANRFCEADYSRLNGRAISPILALAPAEADLVYEFPQPPFRDQLALGVARHRPLGRDSQPRGYLGILGLDDPDYCLFFEPLVGVL